MPTENRHRLWAFGKPRIVKHMPRVKTTTVGFYAINGKSVLRAIETLHNERIVEVFEAIREQNPAGRILLVLDNFSSHVTLVHAHASQKTWNHSGLSAYCVTASSANRACLGWSQTNYLADFVSLQAIHTYLTKEYNVSYSIDEGDPVEKESTNIQRLKRRMTTILKSKIERLRDAGRITFGEFNLLIDIRVLCEDCGVQYQVTELLDKGA